MLVPKEKLLGHTHQPHRVPVANIAEDDLRIQIRTAEVHAVRAVGVARSRPITAMAARRVDQNILAGASGRQEDSTILFHLFPLLRSVDIRPTAVSWGETQARGQRPLVGQ